MCMSTRRRQERASAAFKSAGIVGRQGRKCSSVAAAHGARNDVHLRVLRAGQKQARQNM